MSTKVGVPTNEELLLKIVAQNRLIVSQQETILERLDELEERISNISRDYGEGFNTID